MLLSIIVLLCFHLSQGQYSIQSPWDGHEGIHYTDSQIKSWASTCEVKRGYRDITNPSLGFVTGGKEEYALGEPVSTNVVLCLGDGGEAILSFNPPIANQEGYDFVVFENGFHDLDNDTLAFLELAFVEVSSDGENYFRFPAISLTQNEEQIDGFGVVDARHIHNLAGKHVFGYGTSFDLDEIEDHDLLDKQSISHVKIIDVIGNIDPAYASYDSQGNIINDPFPTPFPSGGFDLAGIGVIHQGIPKKENPKPDLITFLYPNPTKDILYLNQDLQSKIAQVYDITGKLVWEDRLPSNAEWDIQFLDKGWYIIKIEESVFKIIKI